MKHISILIVSLTFLLLEVKAQEINPADSTGLPGDHFSLEGALDLFKQAKSPEDFEKLLNTEENNVNNLDLNDDGNIDYISVNDIAEGDAHAIILSVAVNENEKQDVATLELEKQGDESAIVQIIGAEELYGTDVFVEPFDEKAEGGKKGPEPPLETVHIIVNVWLWPCVHFMFAPIYVPWVSPWHWMYYPVWWRPWHPHPWSHFYAGCHHFHNHYHPINIHRTTHAHVIYHAHRSTSSVVHERYRTAHERHRAQHERAKQGGGKNDNRKALDRDSNKKDEGVKGNQSGRDGKTTRTDKEKNANSGKSEKNASRNTGGKKSGTNKGSKGGRQ